MKVEDLPVDCRNILAASPSYICYSVTQRKNLLRVIDTQQGEKVILRGHEHSVLDLRFATSDPSCLCSVDCGGGAAENYNDATGKPHTIVWKRQNGDWEKVTELPLRATMVRPHPTQSNIWAIANKGKVGIFSSSRHGSASTAPQVIGAFESLPMNISLQNGETVTGISLGDVVLYF